MKPQRIQRKRTKGFNLQQVSKASNGLDCVYVGRPTKFGNPYKVGSPFFNIFTKKTGIFSIDETVDCFEFWLKGKLAFAPNFLDELRGKNLACFCPLDSCCHADVLLEYANK